MDVVTTLKNTNWRIIAAAFFAIAILHILATLVAPELTTSSGYDRLSRGLPVNKMQVLPPVAPGAQPLPFMSPDARYALCRFDTTDGSVAVTAVLPGPGWTLALYSTEGENFYTSVAQPGRRTNVSLLLVPTDDRFIALAPQARGEPAQADSTLAVPAQKGVVVLRAPDQGLSYRARNLAELKRARCAYRPL
jgi:uncharacterized membrane protein